MLFVKLKKLSASVKPQDLTSLSFYENIRRKLLSNAVVRWWIVGLFFMGVNIPLLYGFVEWGKLSLLWATFLASEIGTIFRFLVNDRWVFGHSKPTWGRLWQYHVAIASSFVIWYSVANILPHYGIHYLIASVLATCCSVGWSMITNFLWIWRKKAQVQEMESLEN